MTESAPTRTDRRRARTREKLIAAGRQLIAAKGVAGLRIQDITEVADIAQGSFYNYFPTKEDLVEAIVSESLEALASASVPAADEAGVDPAIATAKAARRIIRLAFDDAEFAGLLVNLNHADVLFEKAMYPYAREVLARGVESGRFQTPDIAVTLNLIIGGSMSLIRAILAGEFADGAEIVHAEVVLRALGIPPDEAARISFIAAP